MPNRIWTIGYSGKSCDELADLLTSHGIKTLVDIRWNPISRKKGFSKSGLWELAVSQDIEYRHLKSLGAPSELREELAATRDFQAFSIRYLAHMAEQTEDLDQLQAMAKRRAVCILCTEEHPAECHRGLLASHLETRGFKAVHLGLS